ncbi:hypothetical protein L1F06_016705 [Ectopseudomonas hydrolytica]|uniref:Uncharacterized protein n=1 Tax=Ectopseudomonas hydrolytica TaxID=2493633 RepID=A0ABY5A373_9GAMM|nr:MULTISPECIES: hypothetical protein [Pseudomonas]MDH0097990.1 hypothetical protein [Pseudomonas sp. GD04158]USR38303.1 hypothetical protein L1F06_016705 [Pseudomonas hydrolytica]
MQAIQDQRSALSNYLHRQLAVGNGFLLGAWGLLRTAKEFSDLVNPFTTFSNALRSAWQARASEGETWLAAYNRQFSAEQHRELVEALGFDPSSITREQLAETYELACFTTKTAPARPCSAASPSTMPRHRTSRRSPSSAAAHCSKSCLPPC